MLCSPKQLAIVRMYRMCSERRHGGAGGGGERAVSGGPEEGRQGEAQRLHGERLRGAVRGVDQAAVRAAGSCVCSSRSVFLLPVVV